MPEAWSHAVRSDHFVFHRREHRADWTRLVVSLTNCFVTAASAWLLARWLLALGFLRRTALVTGLAFAFATSAWAYSRTFLSEPLSGLCLIAAAYCVTLQQAGRGSRWLWLAGAIAGFSVHVHALNVVFVPCLIGYALAGRRRAGMAGMLAMLGLGAGLLLLGQWLRFGDPLETGRFGHYSEFVAPWEGMAAQLVAPGRSFLLYSPAAALGLLGFGALRRRLPAVFVFAAAAMLLRWLVISTRSDWYGGWGLGPRHLVPVIPLAMLGFAAALERAGQWRRWARWAWWLALGLGVLLFTLAHHRMVDHFRTHHPHASLDAATEDGASLADTLAADSGFGPLRQLQSREQAQALLDVLAALPAVQRDAFLLQAEGALTVADIAATTGVPVETAKSRLRYARATLRQTLEGLL